MNKVIVVGSSNTDMVATPHRFPHPGETLLGSEFYTFPGGKGANQAVACKRAGADTEFVCAFGQDMLGDAAIAALKQDGITVDRCFRIEGVSSGVGIILVSSETGENMIVVALGANMHLSKTHLSAIDFSAYDVALFQMENDLSTVAFGLQQAFNAGCTTILNPAPAQAVTNDMLKYCHIVTPNEHELKILSTLGESVSLDEAAKSLLERGVRDIIVTCGSQGALHYAKTGTQQYPTIKVEAVDTVGAGDCFSGCLAASLSSGATIQDAIPFALCGASLSVTIKGAQPSMPTKQQISTMLTQ